MEGRVLAGRFQLIEILGQGGMGSVWRARHLQLGTDVAVKLMDASLATNREGLARFRREAQAAASLSCPNVVRVFDYGIDECTPFIAMEILHGENLAKRLERVRRLSPREAAIILGQVARAVARAHDAGIVHRDLKPENVFLVRDDDGEIAKVLDFGIAKRIGPDSYMTGAVETKTGTMLGTPYYMSPEQINGKKDLDHRTDIWSFGVIAGECLTGRRMFEAEILGGLVLAICRDPLPVPSQLGPVPPGFDTWFARCNARDPKVRFSTIQEAAAQFETICGIQAHGRAPFSAIPTAREVASTNTPQASPRGGSESPSATLAGPTSVTAMTRAQRGRAALLRVGVGLGLVLLSALTVVGLGLSVFQTAPHGPAVSATLETAALKSTVLAATPTLPTPAAAQVALPVTEKQLSTSPPAFVAAVPSKPAVPPNRGRPTADFVSSSHEPRVLPSLPATATQIVPAPEPPDVLKTVPNTAPRPRASVDLAF